MLYGRRRSSLMLAGLALAPFVLGAPVPDPLPSPDDQPTTIKSNQTDFTNAQNPNWSCPDGFSGALTHDCLEAILDMSANPQMGQFHHEPPKDVFSLPKNYAAKTCNITLDIEPGALDYSSWTDVNVRTTQLINACAKGDNYLGGQSGGTRKAGNYGRINIGIVRASNAPETS